MGDDAKSARAIVYNEQMVHHCIESALQVGPRGHTTVGQPVVVSGYTEQNRGETPGPPLNHEARGSRITDSDRAYGNSNQPEPVKGGGTND